MEDVQLPPEATSENPPMPEAGHDPGDPLRPEVEEENVAATPPFANPHQDMEVTEEGEGEPNTMAAADDDGDDHDDNDSVLSEVDEAQFEDFDPNAINIEDRPAIAVDESNVGVLGVHKRKRTDAELAGEAKKKRKEKRRDKPKKSRKKKNEEEGLDGVEEPGRRRKKGVAGRRDAASEDDEDLTPEERRRRALDRAMDDAMKRPSQRRKRKDIDLVEMADAEIEDMRRRMTEAAMADNEGKEKGQPAMHKLKLLPEVVALLNRNTLQNNLVDPDINLLEAVRFFLEPLNDGSLPAYNIQRELFAALSRLPITKEGLVASGIGKVVMFYTKTKRAEPGIKRQAEKLLNDWTRPILKRDDNYRNKGIEAREFDPTQLAIRSSQAPSSQARAAAAAASQANGSQQRISRARPDTAGPLSYTIAPKSNVQVPEGRSHRAPGGGADAIFRKMRANKGSGR